MKVDEEGCEAAAYTVVMVEAGGAMPPDDEVDFTLDRPFLFAVTGDSDLPLFTGVVNQPNGSWTPPGDRSWRSRSQTRL